MSAARWLYELYDRTHGQPRDQIVFPELGDTAEARRACLRDTLMATGWDTRQPTASSRVFELLVWTARASGDEVALLEEAFVLLGSGDGSIQLGVEWGCEQLRIGFVSSGAAVDTFWFGQPALTEAQAVLALSFLPHPCPMAEFMKVQAALGIAHPLLRRTVSVGVHLVRTFTEDDILYAVAAEQPDDGLQLIFARARGGDTYSITTHTAATHDGGVVDVETAADFVELELDGQASRELDLPWSFRLELAVSSEEASAFIEGLMEVLGTSGTA